MNEISFFIFSVMFTTYPGDMNAFILRLPCERAANFSIIKHDVVLQGSVIATFMFTDIAECQTHCVFMDNCQSINYQEHGDNKCELNNITTENARYGARLTPRSGWKYVSTDHKQTRVGHNCEVYNPCPPGVLCTDICEVPGYKCHICGPREFGLHCQTAWQDCQDVMDAGYRSNGTYIINPTLTLGGYFSVYCKFQLETGLAWTVIQRRMNELEFNRSWTEYENGFGSFSSSFWLGLKQIHALTAGRGLKVRLHIDITSKAAGINKNGFAEYGEFSIGNSSEKYELHVANFDANSTISDDIQSGKKGLNLMKFTTFDQDNDISPEENCAATYSGGWWFSDCFAAHLNGRYPPKDLVMTDCKDYSIYAKYLSWLSFNNCYGDVTYSEMKVRNN